MDKEIKKGIYLTFLGICGTFWMDPLLYYVTENGNYSYAVWNNFFPELGLFGLTSIILAFPFFIIIIAPTEHLLRGSDFLCRFKSLRRIIFWVIADLVASIIIIYKLLGSLGQNQNVYLEMHFLFCQVYYFMILNLCFFPWMIQRAWAKIKDSEVELL